MEPNIFKATCSIFNEAAAEGIALAVNDGAEVNRAFLDALRHNNEVFAAFRTHKMQKDIAAQLLDSDGKLKSFARFVRDSAPYVDHKNRAWLQTEYNTAVNRAHQAARWQQFESEADVYPNLRWVPSTSPNPGADHKIFWDTVLPINHPFWDSHRPGDRWNCKCDLEQSDDPVTPAPVGSRNDDPAPGLENNPAKDKQLFSNKHPYFPKSCSACFAGDKSKLKSLFYNLAGRKNCSNCPLVDSVCEVANREKGCEVIPTKRGSVTSHVEQSKAEKKANEDTAKFLAEKYGYDYTLLPPSKTVGKTTADAVNRQLGITQEFKLNKTNTFNALDSALRCGAKQSKHVVVRIVSDMTDEMICRVLKDRIPRIRVKSVWIIKNEKCAKLSSEDLENISSIKEIEWE